MASFDDLTVDSITIRGTRAGDDVTLSGLEDITALTAGPAIIQVRCDAHVGAQSYVANVMDSVSSVALQESAVIASVMFPVPETALVTPPAVWSSVPASLTGLILVLRRVAGVDGTLITPVEYVFTPVESLPLDLTNPVPGAYVAAFTFEDSDNDDTSVTSSFVTLKIPGWYSMSVHVDTATS